MANPAVPPGVKPAPQAGANSQALKRKPSMFEPSNHKMHNLTTLGSSTCTFGEDPGSEIYLMKKFATKYQNTYKVEPDTRFNTSKVQAIAEQILLDHLEDAEYNESDSRKLVKNMSDKILKAVKNLGYKRHKIVVIVNIGQLNNQVVRVGSRCLWHTQHDNFAGASFEGKYLWATATIYGVYQE